MKPVTNINYNSNILLNLKDDEKLKKGIVDYTIMLYTIYNGYDEIKYKTPEIKFASLPETIYGKFEPEIWTIYIEENIQTYDEFISTLIHESVHVAQKIYDTSIESLYHINDEIEYKDSPIEQEARMLSRLFKPNIVAYYIYSYYKGLFLYETKEYNENKELCLQYMSDKIDSFINSIKEREFLNDECDFEGLTSEIVYQQMQMYTEAIVAIESVLNALKTLKKNKTFVVNRIKFLESLINKEK